MKALLRNSTGNLLYRIYMTCTHALPSFSRLRALFLNTDEVWCHTNRQTLTQLWFINILSPSITCADAHNQNPPCFFLKQLCTSLVSREEKKKSIALLNLKYYISKSTSCVCFCFFKLNQLSPTVEYKFIGKNLTTLRQ